MTYRRGSGRAMTAHRPRLHRDPPEAPVPWFDPDPLTVEPELFDHRAAFREAEVDELASAWRGFLVRLALVALLLAIVGLAVAQLLANPGWTPE